jgi:hypothetical protein
MRQYCVRTAQNLFQIPGMARYAYNPSTLEVEAGGSQLEERKGRERRRKSSPRNLYLDF